MTAPIDSCVPSSYKSKPAARLKNGAARRWPVRIRGQAGNGGGDGGASIWSNGGPSAMAVMAVVSARSSIDGASIKC
jgi:hypothetical protein